MTETKIDDEKNEMKIIKEKRLDSCKINCLELIKYKNKDYIVIGLNESYSKKSIIEIYDSINLELIGRNDTDLEYDEINYISKMYNQNLLVCGSKLRIFTFYFENLKLNMKLVQLEEYPKIDNKYNRMRIKRFTKAFVLDRNLYRDPEDKISSLEGEILINESLGIYIYKRKKKENNEINEEGNLSINYLEKSEDINELNINDYAEKWNSSPYKFNEQVSSTVNFDVIQINYRYLAVTRPFGNLCILDIETKNLITIFEVKSSVDADRVIFMLNKYIICVGGDDGLSLISIKDYDVPLLYVIKPKFKVTEICIMDEFNVLITMRSGSSYNYKEYLLHYKLIPEKDNISNKMLFKAIQVSSELTSKRRSNLTMASIDRNKFVCIIENKIIQIREIN